MPLKQDIQGAQIRRSSLMVMMMVKKRIDEMAEQIDEKDDQRYSAARCD